mmetsp:Transcript_87017/g.202585  ORF Transcript_87017/g.202585 Transcript_87017/m.202585 type:complete len:246 (-) Transcript_87017:18-755(-)
MRDRSPATAGHAEAAVAYHRGRAAALLVHWRQPRPAPASRIEALCAAQHSHPVGASASVKTVLVRRRGRHEAALEHGILHLPGITVMLEALTSAQVHGVHLRDAILQQLRPGGQRRDAASGDDDAAWEGGCNRESPRGCHGRQHIPALLCGAEALDAAQCGDAEEASSEFAAPEEAAQNVEVSIVDDGGCEGPGYTHGRRGLPRATVGVEPLHRAERALLVVAPADVQRAVQHATGRVEARSGHV